MTFAKPLISWIIPAYHAEETIASALRSCLEQTLDDFEVIVIDDGSKDSTAKRVKELAASDHRINYFCQENKGIVSALNYGLSVARGDYIARMDADDISFSNRLEAQYQLLSTKESERWVISSLVESFGSKNENAGWIRYIEWLNRLRSHRVIIDNLLVESPLAHPSIFAPKALFDEVGGYRDFDGPEDYDLWLRLAKRNVQFEKVEDVLLRWRDHDLRLTRSDKRYRVEAFDQLKADFLRDVLTLEKRGAYLWGAGKDGKRFLKALEKAEIRIKALIDVDEKKINRSYKGYPILSYQEVNQFAPDQDIILIAVGVEAIRQEILAFLSERGFINGKNAFICL